MRAPTHGFALLAALVAGLMAPIGVRAQAVSSIKLTDVIKSTGTGNIDLLKDVTPAQLEGFRQQGSGALKFAVDVNEAASGTEKSGSQAVTLDTVVLRVTVGGSAQTFGNFSTPTQALLARAGSTVRQSFYTLIGESGSNRITGDAIRDEFDAVLTVPVAINLSSVTTAVLEVKLLQVNASLGDPEAFYDFSNGFEDLALLSSADADFFVSLAPGQQEAPAVISSPSAGGGSSAPPPSSATVVSTVSYPSSTDYYTVGYEDLYPSLGDYDFNDLIVAYRVDLGLDASGKVVAISGTAFLIARGAGYSHDWHLRIPNAAGNASGTYVLRTVDPATLVARSATGSFSGSLDLACFRDTRKLFPPPVGAQFTNTEADSSFVMSPRLDFSVALAAPVNLTDLGAAPFDPYIVVRANGYEVHTASHPPTAGSRNALEGRTGFVDPAGFPFAFLLPEDWPFPWERTDLGKAYPLLGEYTSSSGTRAQGWYTQPDNGHVRRYTAGNWKWLLAQ